VPPRAPNLLERRGYLWHMWCNQTVSGLDLLLYNNNTMFQSMLPLLSSLFQTSYS